MTSLAIHSPELIKEWDFLKNGALNPETFSYGSNRKVWWLCSKDSRHSWQASIQKRTSDRGCPICTNRLIVEGINDFATTYPTLGLEIDKGSPLWVEGKLYSPGSDKRLGWRCSSGHTWEATVRNRVSGQGCPFCSGRKVLPGFNDFATRFPHLLIEISKKRNTIFDPTSVFPSNTKRIWWICSKEHEWQASISSRAISNSGCPYCRAETWTRKRRGTQAIFVPGKDDLASRYPSIATEWNLKLNFPLTPRDVKSSDKNRSIWWTCTQDHSYQTSVWNRVVGSGCTICSGRVVVAGVNDFASRSPELVEQFDTERNGGLTPSEIPPSSIKKYWWKCSLGHSWLAPAAARTNGAGCPVCANYQVLSGFNDLLSKRPELDQEWDYEMNRGVKPEDVYFDSAKKFYWTCGLNHSYAQSPQARLRGVDCPVCNNRVLLKGFNDIGTRYPDLVPEWDLKNNPGLTLSDLHSITNKRYFWLCPEGHSWQAGLANRVNGSGCPSCTSYGFDANKSAFFYLIKNHQLRSLKIGIANMGTSRLKIWLKEGWQLVHYIEGDGRQMLNIETLVLRWLRDDIGAPQHLTQLDMKGHKGATETVSQDFIEDSTLIGKIVELHNLVRNTEFRLKRKTQPVEE